MSDSAYLDTSVLAKWYLAEENTEAVTQYIISLEDAFISHLTITEMRCLLAKHRRMRHFSEKIEQQIYATFLNDIQLGYLRVAAFMESHFTMAATLITDLPKVSLRTLDALHLSIVQQAEIAYLATADEVIEKAAKQLGIQVKRF